MKPRSGIRAMAAVTLALGGLFGFCGTASPAASETPVAMLAVAGPLAPEDAAQCVRTFLADHLTGAGHYLVQITDVHIGGGAEAADGGGLFARFHPSEKLARALDAIARFEPQPDYIVITGDLADHGLAEEWSRFLSIVAEHASSPTLLVRGNHDASLPGFLQAFAERPEIDAGRMRDSGVCYRLDWEGCRLLVLDTDMWAAEGAQATWLDGELQSLGDRAVLAFGHRHTRAVGNLLADRRGVAFQAPDSPALEAKLLEAPGFAGYFCGHVHYTSLAEEGRYRHFSLTSTFYSIDDSMPVEGGLKARLIHADAGKLVWTALAPLDGAPRLEWPAEPAGGA